MKKPLVIVESRPDEILVRKILEAEPKFFLEFETLHVDGVGTAYSLARSSLVVGGTPVALVLSSEPKERQRLREMLQQGLAAVAREEYWELCVLEGELTDLLSRRLPRRPKHVIAELIKQPDSFWKPVIEQPPFRALADFILRWNGVPQPDRASAPSP